MVVFALPESTFLFLGFASAPSTAEFAASNARRGGGTRRRGFAAANDRSAARGFSGFLTFQGFARRIIFLPPRRPPNSPPAIAEAARRGGAAPIRPGREAAPARSRDSGRARR